MTPEEKQELDQHIQGIAKILYGDADKSRMTNLGEIEKVIREQLQEHVSPQIGGFFIGSVTETTEGYNRTLKSILGQLRISSEQAQALGVGKGKQLSPYLEECCLRSSANVSYAHAEEDVAVMTGIRVSAKTQQRLVQGHPFPMPTVEVENPITETRVDGGKVRLRTPVGEPSSWRDDKAIDTNAGVVANFQNNSDLIDWVNHHPLASLVTCLGDGHDGVWNIVAQIAVPEQRREILDWYHLKENLHKVGGSIKRLQQAETLLWQGKVDQTITLLADLKRKQAHNFCQYLKKHRHRIVNYAYYQAEEICSIGSGGVESAIKQIDRRVQISGAQWNPQNVPQVLAHRTTYLNGLFSL
ncbi:ISKra4 family transposase [Kovacikia minuta CCNUW1]|uniref:ISKra4 family transposase n=1 Tax=Kovacikia minuta TaxID=2931930 RepID=UPI001CCE77C4|nr:ISKra4 family transposase [Kovacikia minuta]UBF25049.1 ISKra4 family transposase [Kovacikia minuta CCNUW1]